MSETTALSVRGLRKSFGDGGVLQGIDLDVRDNELLVLLGPNGVGKTVLLSCMAGSTIPSAGSVEVYEKPIRSVPGKYTSFMRQSSMAVDALTGRENVEFYSRLHTAFTDRWREYVEILGIADDLEKRVENYSGGMKRKLEFAIACSIDVPIYLLDEPTAGVDLSMIQRFHDVILDLHERGRTFVLASHLPADADLADRIAFVRDGEIATVGPPADLLDAVPQVVRVHGTRGFDAALEHVIGDQLFYEGAEARGFVADDAAVKRIEAAVGDDVRVESTRPTYTDLFNYHVHVEGNEQRHISPTPRASQ